MNYPDKSEFKKHYAKPFLRKRFCTPKNFKKEIQSNARQKKQVIRPAALTAPVT